MENRGYVQLTLGTVKQSEVATLGTKIHNYLAGNPLYVECDNIENVDEVYIRFNSNKISKEDILKYTKDILDIYSLYLKEILNDKISKEEEEIKMEPTMAFEDALTRLKRGEAVARQGWNGKGMFLYMVGPGNYTPCTPIAEKIAAGQEDGKVPYGAYIAMKTAQGNVVPWLCSQTDMLAEDWVSVEVI